MKNYITKIMTIALLVSLFTYSLAFAADPIKCVVDNGTATVTVEVDSLEETTLLVVPMGTTIEAAFKDTTLVYYINQTAANSNGVATFTFVPEDDASYDIYSGYATMGVNDAPYKTVIDKSDVGGDDPVDTPYILGDVNNDGQVSAADVGSIIQYVLSRAPFLDSATSEEYEYGVLAADITYDGSVTAGDVGYVIDYCLNRTPFPAAPTNQ